jgi:hypothetical protein
MLIGGQRSSINERDLKMYKYGSGANNQHEQIIFVTHVRFRLEALRSRLQVQLDLERRDVAV